MEAVKLRTQKISGDSYYILKLARHKDKQTGLPVDFSGLQALRMDVRAGTSMKSTLVERFDLTAGGASVETDPETGAPDTLQFTKAKINWPAGTLYFDILLTDDENRTSRWYYGEIVVRKSITESEI